MVHIKCDDNIEFVKEEPFFNDEKAIHFEKYGWVNLKLDNTIHHIIFRLKKESNILMQYDVGLDDGIVIPCLTSDIEK